MCDIPRNLKFSFWVILFLVISHSLLLPAGKKKSKKEYSSVSYPILYEFSEKSDFITSLKLSQLLYKNRKYKEAFGLLVNLIETTPGNYVINPSFVKAVTSRNRYENKFYYTLIGAREYLFKLFEDFCKNAPEPCKDYIRNVFREVPAHLKNIGTFIKYTYLLIESVQLSRLVFSLYEMFKYYAIFGDGFDKYLPFYYCAISPAGYNNECSLLYHYYMINYHNMEFINAIFPILGHKKAANSLMKQFQNFFSIYSGDIQYEKTISHKESKKGVLQRKHVKTIAQNSDISLEKLCVIDKLDIVNLLGKTKEDNDTTHPGFELYFDFIPTFFGNYKASKYIDLIAYSSSSGIKFISIKADVSKKIVRCNQIDWYIPLDFGRLETNSDIRPANDENETLPRIQPIFSEKTKVNIMPFSFAMYKNKLYALHQIEGYISDESSFVRPGTQVKFIVKIPKYAISAFNLVEEGKLKWSNMLEKPEMKIPKEILSQISSSMTFISPFSISRGKLYAGAVSLEREEVKHYILSLDALTGKVLWILPISSNKLPTTKKNIPEVLTRYFALKPLITEDAIYYYTNSATLVCVNRYTGNIMWQIKFKENNLTAYPGGWSNNEIVLRNNYLIFTPQDMNNIFIVDIHNGTLVDAIPSNFAGERYRYLLAPIENEQNRIVLQGSKSILVYNFESEEARIDFIDLGECETINKGVVIKNFVLLPCSSGLVSVNMDTQKIKFLEKWPKDNIKPDGAGEEKPTDNKNNFIYLQYTKNYLLLLKSDSLEIFKLKVD